MRPRPHSHAHSPRPRHTPGRSPRPPELGVRCARSYGVEQKAEAIARCDEAGEAVYRRALLRGTRLLRHVPEAARGATRRSASPFARAWNVLGRRQDCASKGSRVLEEYLMRRRMTRATHHTHATINQPLVSEQGSVLFGPSFPMPISPACAAGLSNE